MQDIDGRGRKWKYGLRVSVQVDRRQGVQQVREALQRREVRLQPLGGGIPRVQRPVPQTRVIRAKITLPGSYYSMYIIHLLK